MSQWTRTAIRQAEENDTGVENTLTDASSTAAEISNTQSGLSGPIGVYETYNIQTLTEFCKGVIATNNENEPNTSDFLQSMYCDAQAFGK